MRPLSATPRVRRVSWALMDGAREPFFSIVLSIVFPPFFVGHIAADPVSGTAQWGYALSGAALLLVLLAPVAGVIADLSRRRKWWIGGCIGVAALALVSLWPATADVALPYVVIGLCVLAYVAIELTRVFTDGLIARVANPDEIGRLSGLGVGIGFAATFAYLGAVSVGSRLSFEPGIVERAATTATGVWLVLLAIPFFVFCPGGDGSRSGDRAAFEGPLGRVAAALMLLRRDRQLGRFLLARMAYWDGTMALFAFLTILASTQLGWGVEALTRFGLLGLLAGAVAGLAAGRLDAKLGARNSILLSLVGLLVCTVVLFVTSGIGRSPEDRIDERTGIDEVFLATGVIASACLGVIMSSSRALLARLAPAQRLGEYFGLYVMVGRASSFIAPLLVAVSTSLSGNQRLSVFGVAMTLLAGGVALLSRVQRC